jgi:hypothetical protein
MRQLIDETKKLVMQLIDEHLVNNETCVIPDDIIDNVIDCALKTNHLSMNKIREQMKDFNLNDRQLRVLKRALIGHTMAKGHGSTVDDHVKDIKQRIIKCQDSLPVTQFIANDVDKVDSFHASEPVLEMSLSGTKYIGVDKTS